MAGPLESERPGCGGEQDRDTEMSHKFILNVPFMKVQQAVTTIDIQRLLEQGPEQGPLVSMILPMEVRGPETRQNSVRLKSALRRVRDLLAEQSLEAGQIDSLLAPAEQLVADEDFWQHQEQSLALYLAPGTFETFRLMSSFRDTVSVAPRFHVSPLIHAAARQPVVYVLSLARNEVVLYKYERGELQVVEVEDMPTDEVNALMLDPEETAQRHVVSNNRERSTPVMGGHVTGGHGQAGYKDQRVGHLVDFLRSVESAVRRHLEKEQLPLYLATVEENDALYRQVNHYGRLAGKSLRGSFQQRSRDELLRALVPVLEAGADEAARAACESVAESVSTGAGTTHLDEAIVAASDGRVGACVLALESPPRTGTFDPMAREVTQDGEPTPHHSDLSELLAVTTFCHSGEVYFAPREALPEEAEVAVSFRY